MPVDVLDQEVLPDGMVKLRYRYQADGEASGGLPGSFTYDESGHYLSRGGSLVGGGPEKQMIVLIPVVPGAGQPDDPRGGQLGEVREVGEAQIE